MKNDWCKSLKGRWIRYRLKEDYTQMWHYKELFPADSTKFFLQNCMGGKVVSEWEDVKELPKEVLRDLIFFAKIRLDCARMKVAFEKAALERLRSIRSNRKSKPELQGKPT